MTYWWVNQNQTLRQEIEGGYIWSPFTNKGGARNEFYLNLQRVSVGDWILSYANQQIGFIGVAKSIAYDSPKPHDYGAAGDNWAANGWKVDIEWHNLNHPARPAEFIDQLRPALPSKYSPLRSSGSGNQGVYLAKVNNRMAEIIFGHLSILPTQLNDKVSRQGLQIAAENEVLDGIENDKDLSATEKQTLVQARRGQGKFRSNVAAIDPMCRLTGVSDDRFLNASHIKPWRSCETNSERIDGANGLMLSPNADRLFDRGFVTFEQTGNLLVSSQISPSLLQRLGITDSTSFTTSPFSDKQESYLSFHRAHIFLNH
jgi:hypothetical protein